MNAPTNPKNLDQTIQKVVTMITSWKMNQRMTDDDAELLAEVRYIAKNEGFTLENYIDRIDQVARERHCAPMIRSVYHFRRAFDDYWLLVEWAAQQAGMLIDVVYQKSKRPPAAPL